MSFTRAPKRRSSAVLPAFGRWRALKPEKVVGGGTAEAVPFLSV